MPERIRAYYKDDVVTVLDGKIGAKAGKTRIRTATGFVKDVSSRDLKPIDSSEPNRKFVFGEGNDF